jgi:transketolase
MEGISNEAMSLAGHLKLNNLIVLYDDNKISIDGSTDLTFTENTKDKYIAMGWDVMVVEDGNEDIETLNYTIGQAKSSDKPVLIMVKTNIGFGTSKENSEKSHGSPLGDNEIELLKIKFGFDPNKKFNIPDDVKDHFNNLVAHKSNNYIEWYHNFEVYKRTFINEYNELKNIIEEKIIIDLPVFSVGDKDMATREISGICIQKLYKKIPQMIGGSADLSPSNNTKIDPVLDSNNYNGNYIHYGVREHAMCAIANGLSTCGFIPYVGTFLVFITYCLGAIRMSALSKHQVLYVLTHDSIGLGKDGPTHQPIESLTILRSIPNLLTFRPADAKEVCGCYEQALRATDKPSALILSRQKLPQLVSTYSKMVSFGGYTLKKGNNIILIATGSEVSLALKVMVELENEGMSTGVVSILCCELFDIQDKVYKDNTLPKNIMKVSLEAGSTIGWHKYADYCIGIDNFGLSGPGNEVMEHFGFKDEIKNFFIDSI